MDKSVYAVAKVRSEKGGYFEPWLRLAFLIITRESMMQRQVFNDKDGGLLRSADSVPLRSWLMSWVNLDMIDIQ